SVVVEAADGEAAKTPAHLAELLEALARAELSRDDVVVAVGGGALTDLAGLAAALYRRGVGVVMVPTTLAGQADAAIGGKTAVNLDVGKNLMGAIHQPLGVLCDLDTLATLPTREMAAGSAEIAKCWLLERRGAASVATTSLADRVAVAAALKAAVVSADEREAGGRALLNYGHTLAHALEAIARERGDDLRHGEAVAVGLAFAARLARGLGRVGGDAVAEHDATLAAFGLSGRPPFAVAADDLLAAMAHDKKSRHDLAFVLDGPGGFALVAGVAPTAVARELELFWEAS
ncbi:MAG TPA: 3-dehydroquinate synthase family protein, partial [Acidimicrobiales bacterium]|nr:3-dehydroquinate synthase family protein [Acidimicrobiales bacterium]